MMMLGVEVEIYAEIEAKQAEILRYINFYKSEKVIRTQSILHCIQMILTKRMVSGW